MVLCTMTEELWVSPPSDLTAIHHSRHRIGCEGDKQAEGTAQPCPHQSRYIVFALNLQLETYVGRGIPGGTLGAMEEIDRARVILIYEPLPSAITVFVFNISIGLTPFAMQNWKRCHNSIHCNRQQSLVILIAAPIVPCPASSHRRIP